MNAVVTGGGGFLGSYIVEMLIKEGYKVFVIGRKKKYEYVQNLGAIVLQVDIRDKESLILSLKDKNIDIVFHTAAKPDPWGKWIDYKSINIDGTLNIIDACKKLNIKYLVYTSSPSVVFSGKDLENIDESYPYPSKHLSYYTKTKAIAEKFVLQENGNNIFTTSLRPHLIFGPRDNHLFPRIIERAKKRKIIQIGNGKNKIDIVYAENAAYAHLLAAKSLLKDKRCAGKSYFISQGEPVFLWDFVKKIIESLNLPPIKRKVPYNIAYTLGFIMEILYKTLNLKGEPFITRFLVSELAKSHYFSIENAKKDLGYSPIISTEEGFKKTIDYFKNILNIK